MHRPGHSTITTTTTRSGTGRPTQTQRTVKHEPFADQRAAFDASRGSAIGSSAFHRGFGGARTNMDDVMFDAVFDDRHGGHGGGSSRRTTETTFGGDNDADMMSHHPRRMHPAGASMMDRDDAFGGRMRQQPPWRIPERYAYEPMVGRGEARGHFGGSGSTMTTTTTESPGAGGDVTDDAHEFAVRLPTQGYKPDELKVEVTDDVLTISGVHEEKAGDGSTSQRQFKRSYKLGMDADVEALASELSADGAVLTVRAPKKRAAIQNEQPTPIKVQFNNKPEAKTTKSETSKKPAVQGAPDGLPEIEVCEYD